VLVTDVGGGHQIGDRDHAITALEQL
jgi:hypothetical protein